MVGGVGGNGCVELLTTKISHVSMFEVVVMGLYMSPTYAAPEKSFAANSALPSAFNASALAMFAVVGKIQCLWEC